MIDARKSFEGIALAELPVLYRVALRMVHQPSDAEDLVSQTLLSAARAWATFDGRHGRSWLIKIMKNQHLMNLRKVSSHLKDVCLEDAPEVGDDPWRDLDARLIADNIVTELDLIPEEYRLAVVLCDMEGMSYQEAADSLEVPIGTVRSRLFRGRRILRDRLALKEEP